MNGTNKSEFDIKQQGQKILTGFLRFLQTVFVIWFQNGVSFGGGGGGGEMEKRIVGTFWQF